MDVRRHFLEKTGTYDCEKYVTLRTIELILTGLVNVNIIVFIQ